MKCENCNKRQAEVHITNKSPDGEVSEQHLCEECASELHIVPKKHMSLDEILDDFIHMKAPPATETASKSCETCGITWAEFKQTGLLGCPDDYELFRDRLEPLLERAHAGASHHCGKVPQRIDSGPRVATELARLKRELAQAVDAEDYELAASLRDQIAETETTINRQNKPPSDDSDTDL